MSIDVTKSSIRGTFWAVCFKVVDSKVLKKSETV